MPEPDSGWLRKTTWRNLVGSAMLLLMGTIYSEPRVPDNENEVLETLPTQLFRDSELNRLRQKVASQPENIILVSQLATAYIKVGRTESDPRFFSYASALLVPWETTQQTPAEILLIRATLSQHYHDFQKATQDLLQLLKLQPYHSQAWLTLATIQMVQGQYKKVPSSCAALAKTSESWISMICYSQLLGLTGSAERGRQILKTLLPRMSRKDKRVRQWILSHMAEMSDRSGDYETAESDYKKALEIEIRDPHLLRSYTDLLIQQGRHEDVLERLKHETQDDALLLQLTRASRLADKPQLLHHYQHLLELRYSEASLRGSDLHQREEALYHLEITQQTTKAHELALANWDQQKEPYDTLLLLRTSITVGDKKSIQKIRQYMSRSQLEDVRIQRLLSQLTDTELT